MPNEPMDWWETAQRMNREYMLLLAEYEELLTDWMFCDVANPAEIEELRERSRRLMNAASS